MTAVWYRFRVELRARWRAVLALALLAGMAGGVAVAAAAGSRRTDTAFSRLLDRTSAWQVLVNPDDRRLSVGPLNLRGGPPLRVLL